MLNATAQAFMPFDSKAVPEIDSIPLCEPEIRGNEWAYIRECLDTNWVSSVGDFVDRFEADMASYLGAKHAVAVCNGTAALHTALMAAGIQKDEEVLVSTLSFIAPANAIRYVGAWPVFMDAEPLYWQMDVEKTLDFLQRQCRWKKGGLYNRNSGRRVTAILPVHILGHPVDMDPLLEAAAKYDLRVIEDASESLGARYQGKMVGTLGDIACFSFNGNKLITTGGGGMVVTNRSDWAERSKYLSTQAKDDPQEYIHGEIGYNYRLTNIQAAMGCAQLEKIDDFIQAKRDIAQKYIQAFSKTPGIFPMREAKWAYSTYWLSTIIVDEMQFGMDARRLRQVLTGCRIQSRPLWQPLHCSPAHRGAQAYHCETAEAIFSRGLSLPSSVGLTGENQKEICLRIHAADASIDEEKGREQDPRQ